MDRITLTLTEGKHRFRGRVVAATRNEANVRSNFGLYRQVIYHRVYLLPDKSFLLYEQTLTIGGGSVGRVHPLASIDDVLRHVPEKTGNHIINQFIDAMTGATVEVTDENPA